MNLFNILIDINHLLLNNQYMEVLFSYLPLLINPILILYSLIINLILIILIHYMILLMNDPNI